MLREQIAIQANDKPPLMFIDLPHYHAECNRNDLFEVRPCQVCNKYKYEFFVIRFYFYSQKN